MDIFHVFNLFLTYSFLLSLQKSIANRHAAWYNRLKEVRGGDFVVNMKTIGSAVVKGISSGADGRDTAVGIFGWGQHFYGLGGGCTLQKKDVGFR